jgi:DoxX-like family
MQPDTQTAPVSTKMRWAGRILSAIPVLFLLFDGGAKLITPASVVAATVQLGYPERVIPGLGLL